MFEPASAWTWDCAADAPGTPLKANPQSEIRNPQFLAILAAALLGVLLTAHPARADDLPPPDQRAVDFTRDIQPILSEHCYSCHGDERQRSGLRLDQRHRVLEGGDSGPAAVPGDSGESLLIRLVAGLDHRVMPPKGDRLTPEQIGLLRAWIDQGVQWPAAAEVAVTRHVGPEAGPREIDPIYELLLMDVRQQFLRRREARLAGMAAPPEPPVIHQPDGGATPVVYNQIDQFIVSAWIANGLEAATEPPPVCSDETFLRRVYLDVIGRVPTLAEAGAFLQDPSPGRREGLVDQLLTRDEEYAAHWTPFWEEALTSSPFAVVGGIPSRGDHKDWIFQSFRQNKPYDLMVAELLDPKMPGHRPTVVRDVNSKPTQVGFLLNSTHTDTIQTAANVGQVFLGTGMKCASCHSHFENAEWPQERFMGFAGLFAGTDLELIRCEKPSGRLIPGQFPFELPGVPDTPPPALEGRLHYLTLLLTDPTNQRFSQTIVNRLWKRYLGLGLFEPADDYREDAPPSHPELLEWLAYDFMKAGFDLKHTIRLILTSRTYQLQYDPRLEDRFDVSQRTASRYYRSPSLRRVTAEQLIDSIRLIKQQELPDDQRLYHRVELTALTRVLGRPPSRSEVSTARPEDVAVVQALELMNGREFHTFVYERDGLAALLDPLETPEAIDTLYLAVLSRRPSESERLLAEAFVASGTVRAEAMRDMLWALLCSPEFQYVY